MRKLSMEELNRKTVNEFKEAEKNKIIVVLDNVRSVYNVGSIFRTADAFLIEAIFICGYTPDPSHRQMNKTALGATETVDWIQFSTALDALENLKKNGYTIYSVEQAEGSRMLDEFILPTDQKTAVILGNEVVGVQQDLMQMCEGCIEIPQLGMKHSLNIAVAAGIILYKLSEPRLHRLRNQ